MHLHKLHKHLFHLRVVVNGDYDGMYCNSNTMLTACSLCVCVCVCVMWLWCAIQQGEGGEREEVDSGQTADSAATRKKRWWQSGGEKKPQKFGWIMGVLVSHSVTAKSKTHYLLTVLNSLNFRLYKKIKKFFELKNEGYRDGIKRKETR